MRERSTRSDLRDLSGMGVQFVCGTVRLLR